MVVTFLLDVEDIVAPEADDIARDVAIILTEEGVQATFCVVGERVRQWMQRGRYDVLDALKGHDIGSHTDFHSVHPTVLEYLQGLGWEDGVAEAVRREQPAIMAIREAFGCDPSCWGGPGNTWGPQVTGALAELNVPAVVYAHTRVPSGEPHRFLDLLAYPSGHYAGDGEYHDHEAALKNRRRLVAELEADLASGRRWTEVFLGHPTRILHHEFWDGTNFVAGANHHREEWKPPRRKTASELEAALDSLRQTVRTVLSVPGIELRTIREMNSILATWDARPLTEEEVQGVTSDIERNVRGMSRWVILPPDTPTDDIWLLTSERLCTLRELMPPEL